MKNNNNTLTFAAKINLSDIAIVAFSVGMVALCIYGIVTI